MLSKQIQYSIIFRLILVSCIICLIYQFVSLLTDETAGYFVSLGKDSETALRYAWSLAILIPVISAIPNFGLVPVNFGKAMFICCLMLANVWFASQTVLIPFMYSDMPEERKSLLSDYRQQKQQIDRTLENYQSQVDSMPDNYLTKKKELITKQEKLLSERNIVLSAMKTISESRPDKTDMQKHADVLSIISLIFIRLALEIGVIFLSVFSRQQTEKCFAIFNSCIANPLQDSCNIEQSQVNIEHEKPVEKPALQESCKVNQGSCIIEITGKKEKYTDKEKQLLDHLARQESRALQWQKLLEARVFGKASDVFDLTESLIAKGELEKFEGTKRAETLFHLRNGWGR